MTKAKISEYDAVAANNTDVNGVNISEGCPPSSMNNMGREIMAALKRFETGADGDSLTVGGALVVSGTATTNTLTAGPVSATTLSASSTLSVTGSGSIQGLTVGRGAGDVSTNTAVGASTLGANEAGGTNNTAVGYQALDANTTGDGNTAVGDSALGANTTASNNTAVGLEAGLSNTTGGNITAVGRWALRANTTGNDNTAVGLNALRSNTTGSSNVALGQQALDANTTADNNTAVGYQAGYTNSTGDRNTFLGTTSGYSQTSGFNTFVGHRSGYNSTGERNTFVGAVSSDPGVANYGCGELMTTGAKNTIIGGYNGNQSGLDIRTSSNNIVLSDGDGNPRLYFLGSSTAWNIPTLPILNPYWYNTTSGSAANAIIGSDGNLFRSTSALKYKTDIRDLESININNFRPVRYKSKSEMDDPTKDHFGIIADEVADAGIEELVTRGADGEVEGFQYERLTVVLLKNLQELSAKNDALEARIAALEGN